MRSRFMQVVLASLSAGAVALCTGCSTAGGSAPVAATPGTVAQATLSHIAAGSSGKIEHVVIILQENRSTDNLFHGLKGADTADSGIDSHGNTILLHAAPMVEEYDFGHTHPAFLQQWDNGKMDGTDLNKPLCPSDPGCLPHVPPDPNFAYVQRSDVPEYFTMAERYSFGDRMFQTNQGESYPAHQFIIAGTSEPSVGSNLLVSENPSNGTGCNAPQDAFVTEIDPQGNENQSTYPCFEHPTLMDSLDSAGRSWKYYTNASFSIWNGPNSIKHIREGQDWSDVIVPETRVLDDISHEKLADVSWVNPNAPDSDHPAITNGSGPSWVASIVNALGKSRYWKNTAIFVTWDDWGGWYDHVAPPIYNSYEYGFRVPLIVVSPYAKHGYVSHVTHDFGSILKFTEKTFGLPSLGFADARADDLFDCFDFSKAPRSYLPIPSRHDAQYFITHRGPTLPIDNE